jgi:hypothetical protein
MTAPRFAGGRWCWAHTTLRRQGSILTDTCDEPGPATALPECTNTSSLARIGDVAPIDFGPVTLGATPPPERMFAARSVGTESLSIVAIDPDWPTGAFRVNWDSTGTTCRQAAPVLPGSECHVVVRFEPRTLGNDTAELLFQSNDPRRVTSVRLMGNGVRP